MQNLCYYNLAAPPAIFPATATAGLVPGGVRIVFTHAGDRVIVDVPVAVANVLGQQLTAHQVQAGAGPDLDGFREFFEGAEPEQPRQQPKGIAKRPLQPKNPRTGKRPKY